MISVLQIFKIILGIMLSAFILTILLNFSTSYTEIGESSREVEILTGLKKTIEDVYTTGISTDFEVKGFEEVVDSYVPPNLMTGVSPVSLDPVPTLFVPGEKVSIHRNEYDMGWWKFYFVHALPEMKIIMSPVGKSEAVWNTAGNITKYFPPTENTKTKVFFDIGCNDTGEQIEFFPIHREREYFMKVVLPYLFENGYEFDPCGRKEGHTVITISEVPVDMDFQVIPINSEMGYVHTNNTLEGYKTYLYKNPLDIISLFLGGKKFYDYENMKFLKELSIASDLASREANLLRAKANKPECSSIYSKFVQILGSLKTTIADGDYTNEDDMKELNRKIKESSETYEELEEMGC